MARSPAGVRLACASLAAVFFLSGCGDNNNTQRSALENAALQFGDVACTSFASCQCMDTTAVVDCRTAYAEYFTLMLSEMLLEYPGQKLDQAKFDACMAELRTTASTCPTRVDIQNLASCTDGSKKGPSFFLGTQAEDEWCGNSASCIDGLGCDELLRTCQPKKAAGEPCATVECQTGLYCNSSNTCAQQGAAGETCSVTETRSCQTGLTCVGTTCTAPHALGEDCTDNAGCVSGAYCATTCTALKAGGVTCVFDNECISDECTSGACEPASFCSSFSLFGK